MITKSNCEFLGFAQDNIEIYFSTAKNNISYNRNSEEGLKNLDNLKSYFCVKNIGYCKQIHSDNVIIYKNEISDGDSIITNEKNVAIGVFTADCVPIIIVDKDKKIAAAVHSGWKGTYKDIVIKTVKKMMETYKCNINDLFFYIGPHIMECCYEVSSELIEKFNDKKEFDNKTINNEKRLNLKQCILIQLESIGVNMDNIHTIDACTYCNTEHSLHSYRRQNESYGRMFSFVIIR